jgi:hypothetical protein
MRLTVRPVPVAMAQPKRPDLPLPGRGVKLARSLTDACLPRSIRWLWRLGNDKPPAAGRETRGGATMMRRQFGYKPLMLDVRQGEAGSHVVGSSS